jgi:hypothetical protein
MSVVAGFSAPASTKIKPHVQNYLQQLCFSASYGTSIIAEATCYQQGFVNISKGTFLGSPLFPTLSKGAAYTPSGMPHILYLSRTNITKQNDHQ